MSDYRREQRPGGMLRFLMLQAAAAMALSIWGGLVPGPYAVGFQTQILPDSVRQYGPDHNPRPVLLAMWYPSAGGAPMHFADYLATQETSPAWGTFASRLAIFTRITTIEALFGKSPSALSEEQRKTLDRLLAAPVYARKNAAHLDAKFPILFYGHGHGGTYQENSMLLEYLASYGYVAVSAPFQCPDAAYLADCSDTARLSDIDFLLRYAATLPYVDIRQLGLIGHSRGGQTSIRWAFRNGSARAVVSLNSTIEEWGLDDEQFEALRGDMKDHPGYVTPTLLFAPPWHIARKKGKFVSGMIARSNFETEDEPMKFAPRFEAAVNGLGHEEYTSDGVLADAFLESSRRRKIYEAVCVFTRRFLDTQLKGVADPLDRADDTAIAVKRIPARRISPSALEILAMLEKDGPEKTRENLSRLREDLEPECLFQAARILLEQDRHAEGVQISEWGLRFWQGDFRPYELDAEVRAASGDLAGARASFERALQIIGREKGLSAEEKALARARVEQEMKQLL